MPFESVLKKMSLSRSDLSAPSFTVPAALRVLIRWTECLHGDGSLRETLAALSDLAIAEVVHLHRIHAVTGAQRSIATFDRLASQGARPLTRAHGTALAGPTQSRAKPGTLWAMRDLDRDALGLLDPRVMTWMDQRGLREAMLIPLLTTSEQTDVLEFYLSAPLDRAQRLGLETVAAAVAEAWARRPEGRIARILRAAPAINERLASQRTIPHPLSASNPLGLTAAELRICDKIQHGAPLAEISPILGIAESTLRSHLRSIFAKAGVAGQVGLVRLLLEPSPTPWSVQA
jgi:DNA-binding CsgD family transcriptional regulator